MERAGVEHIAREGMALTELRKATDLYERLIQIG
jgi:hypothetical protein